MNSKKQNKKPLTDETFNFETKCSSKEQLMLKYSIKEFESCRDEERIDIFDHN